MFLELLELNDYIKSAIEMVPNGIVYVVLDQTQIDQAGHYRYQFVFTFRHPDNFIVRYMDIVVDSIIPNEDRIKEIEKTAKARKEELEKQFTENGIKLKTGAWSP